MSKERHVRAPAFQTPARKHLHPTSACSGCKASLPGHIRQARPTRETSATGKRGSPTPPMHGARVVRQVQMVQRKQITDRPPLLHDETPDWIDSANIRHPRQLIRRHLAPAPLQSRQGTAQVWVGMQAGIGASGVLSRHSSGCRSEGPGRSAADSRLQRSRPLYPGPNTLRENVSGKPWPIPNRESAKPDHGKSVRPT